MIKLICSYLLLICFTSSCKTEKVRLIDKEGVIAKLQLIKEIRLIENDSVKVGNASFTKIDADTSLYILDLSSSNLKNFSKNGDIIRIIGTSGKGPKELSSPMYFAFKENEIWVSEFDIDAFKVFSKSGEFLRKVSVRRDIEMDSMKAKQKFGNIIMKMFLGEYVFDTNKSIWYPGIDNNMFIGKPVVIIDSSGKMVKTVGEYPENFDGTDWGYDGSFVDVSINQYLIGFQKSPSFILGDLTNNKEEWISTSKISKPYISEKRPKQYSGDIESARKIAMNEISNLFYAIVNRNVILRQFGSITESSIKNKSEVQRDNFIEFIDLKNNEFQTMRIKGRVCDFKNNLLLIEESDEPDNRRFGLYKVDISNSSN